MDSVSPVFMCEWVDGFKGVSLKGTFYKIGAIFFSTLQQWHGPGGDVEGGHKFFNDNFLPRKNEDVDI